MKIWLINQYASTPATGPGGRHHYLARELARLGHDVTVVAGRQHHLLRANASPDALAEIEQVDGYRLIRIDTARYTHAGDKRRVLAWFVFAYKLASLDRKLGERPDVVLYSSPSLIGFLGAERMARRNGARLVFEVRDIWPLTLVEIGGYSAGQPFIRFMQWVEDRAYRVSDRVISNLPGAVEHMVSRGMKREKFAWISNGFSFDELHVSEPPDRMQTDQAFTIIYAGTLGKANALDVLIDGAALLKSHPDIGFIIVGKGREKEALLERATNLGLKNVTFRDEVPKDKVQHLLQSCEACYIGLTADPLFRFGVSPAKLFDYLASGRPIIYAIDSGDYRPVEQIGAGIQVEPGNPTALADAILTLRAMPREARIRMGENARRAAREQYDYAKLARKLQDVLVDPVTLTI